MIKTMDQAERDAALRVADLMAAAARTAPKGSGKDKVITIILTGEDKAALVKEMHQAATEYKEDFIERDAFNVESSHCVVLIGVTSQPFGLANCKMCGFETVLCTLQAEAPSEWGSSLRTYAYAAESHSIQDLRVFSLTAVQAASCYKYLSKDVCQTPPLRLAL